MNKNAKSTAQNTSGANHMDSNMPRRKFLIGGATFMAAAATLPIAAFAAETKQPSPGDHKYN